MPERAYHPQIHDLDTSDCFVELPTWVVVTPLHWELITHQVERQIAAKARLPTLELPSVRLMRIHSPIHHDHWRYLSRPPLLLSVPRHIVTR